MDEDKVREIVRDEFAKIVGQAWGEASQLLHDVLSVIPGIDVP